MPSTYQDLYTYFGQFQNVQLFPFREETFRRIERITGRPLIAYVTKTHNIPQGVLAYIEDSDLVGFGDLLQSVTGTELDVFLVSNGGSPEVTERIVELIRGRFASVRFIMAANAYSAATMMCFSGDAILMDEAATLGPIDPQINGIPAGAILDSFERVQPREYSRSSRSRGPRR